MFPFQDIYYSWCICELLWLDRETNVFPSLSSELGSPIWTRLTVNRMAHSRWNMASLWNVSSVRLSELDSRRDHESTSRKRKVTGWLFRKGTSIYYCPSMCQAWRQSVWRHAPNPQKQFAVTPAISSIPTCGRGWWCLKTPWSWLTMIIPLRALLYCHITSAVIPDA